MTSALEQSFKKRLHLIAKERNLTPAEIWQNVITERFLVRLFQSSYHTHFVLKGGVLLARYVDIGRETKDLDFAIQHFSNDISALQKTFDDIVRIDVGEALLQNLFPLMSGIYHRDKKPQRKSSPGEFLLCGFLSLW